MEMESSNIYFKPKNKPLQNFLVQRTSFKSDEKCRFIRLPLQNLSVTVNSPAVARPVLGPRNAGVPDSLYHQSMAVVASNTELLESLEGFPEEMAVRIWNTAVELKMLDSPGMKTSCTLATFAEAYPDLMLRQVVLNSLFLINDYHTDLLQLLRGTVKLDLSDMGLDDDHDLLKDLQHLEALTVLILDKNELSDVGIRNFVLPCAGGRKLRKLEYIDVSNNKITKKGLQRLALIKSLKRIVFSPDNYSPKESEVLSGFCVKSRPCLEKFQSDGLGVELIKRWLSIVNSKRKPEKPTSNFYTKKVIAPRVSTNSHSAGQHNKIMLQRSQSSDKVDLTNCKKRPRDSNDVEQRTAHKKMVFEKDIKEAEQFENNLMNIYG